MFWYIHQQSSYITDTLPINRANENISTLLGVCLQDDEKTMYYEVVSRPLQPGEKRVRIQYYARAQYTTLDFTRPVDPEILRHYGKVPPQ